MKILHIIPSYTPAVSALGVIGPMHDLNRELSKLGIDVTVYTTNLDGKEVLNVPLNQSIILDGVKVHYFAISIKPWYYSISLHHALANNLKSFDVVHISSVFLSASTLGAYYARKFNKPYIISPHGALMKKPLDHHALKKKIYFEIVEKRNLVKASAIHFTSDNEEKEYRVLGSPFQKHVLIPYCFESEKFIYEKAASHSFKEKFNIRLDKKVILFLGRISWKKGLDTLIPAFAEVLKKEPEAILVIAGPDDEGYGKNIKYQISNIKLEDKVVFTGPLYNQEKLAALADADVFVLPSYSENFGMAVVEAMSIGLPVVVTKAIGFSEQIAKAGAGLIVEKEVNEVSSALLRILEGPEQAKEMGERGMALVKEYSSDKIARRFAKEYEEIIKSYEASD